jgi:TolB-like protein/class 3 adenylate cyclase/rhodanese-related sulfurtransferase/Flp pilus assembly protein TadD
MAKGRLTGTLAVILHADVAGSTGLVQQDEHLAHERIQETFRRFNDTITKYHGQVCELRGDALLAEFNRASDAVTATLAFQADQSDHNAQLIDNIRPTVRVGIAMGEVIIADNTVTGEGVVLAQRVEQLADPEGLCVTGAIYEALPQRLPLDQESLGEQMVKGFDEPIRVYRVRLNPGESIPPPQDGIRGDRAPANWRLIAALGFTCFVVVGVALYWFEPWAPREEPASVERMAFSLPEEPSIAVLPFDNLSDDPEQEFFADGMTEDLITDLSNIVGLFVISRNATFTYKDKAVKPRQVAEELGVRYIVEGSVRRVGNQVRVNAQLIDAITGFHLWAKKYDGLHSDVFGLQDVVVGQIAAALEINLTSAGTGSSGENETDIAGAYDAFLQGWELYRRDTREDTVKAISFFERALELDPDYGRAHAALASTYWRITERTWREDVGLNWTEAYNLTKDYIANALAQPTSLAYSISSKLLAFDGNSDEALVEIERAIALERNNPDYYIIKSWILIYAGKAEEAEENARLAIRINPNYPPSYLHALGRALFYKGEYQEAAKVFKRIASLEPDRRATYIRLAATYGQLGRLEEARSAVLKYNELVAKTNYTPLTVEEVVIWYEDTLLFEDESYPEPMFEGLGKAGVPEGAAPNGEGFNYRALVSRHIGETGKYYDVEGVPKIDVEAVKALSDRGVTIIDVRDAGNYARGHIPGAINLDLNLELTRENLAKTVDKDDEVVFYCWGKACKYSALACAKAALWRYNRVHYFDGGFPAWKAAGFAVATN